jgi:hypothetical protein
MWSREHLHPSYHVIADIAHIPADEGWKAVMFKGKRVRNPGNLGPGVFLSLLDHHNPVFIETAGKAVGSRAL